MTSVRDDQGMQGEPSVVVVGAGAWGTALATLLAGQGTPTLMWAREPEVVEAINRHHRNPFLADAELPPGLTATGDLDDALGSADVVVSAVPTQHIESVFSGYGAALARARAVVSVSKGIEIDSLRTPTEILDELTEGSLTPVALS